MAGLVLGILIIVLCRVTFYGKSLIPSYGNNHPFDMVKNKTN